MNALCLTLQNFQNLNVTQLLIDLAIRWSNLENGLLSILENLVELFRMIIGHVTVYTTRMHSTLFCWSMSRFILISKRLKGGYLHFSHLKNLNTNNQ